MDLIYSTSFDAIAEAKAIHYESCSIIEVSSVNTSRVTPEAILSEIFLIAELDKESQPV